MISTLPLYGPPLGLLTDLYQLTMAYGYWRLGQQERAAEQLARFHPGVKRFVNPHLYPVGLEKRLFERRHGMMMEARGVAV